MPFGKILHVVGIHAAGEVCDVVVGGVIDVPGKTMFEKMMHLWHKDDGMRQLLLHEPRGCSAMCHNLVLPPCNPKADAGLIIMEHEEYPPMSGANTIATATVLLETGMVAIQEPVTHVKLDTPAGLVTVDAEVAAGKVTSVAFHNVPAFVFGLDVEINVPDLGPIKVDVAWGGMIYCIVDATKLGIEIKSSNGRKLVELGERIKRAVQEQTDYVHPENPEIRGVSILEFTEPLSSDEQGKVAVNTVVVSPGRLDRSPCGTGTCARLALLHARGELQEGESFRHHSIIGTEFVGTISGVAKVGQYSAVLPTVKGSAWITSFKQVVLHPTDPFPEEEKVASSKQDPGVGPPPREPPPETIRHGVVPTSTTTGELNESFNSAPRHRGASQADYEAPGWNNLTNPMSTGPSMFMTSDSGRQYYLGVSSNWSFTRRILSMTYEYVHQSTVPSPGLIFDGETYDVDCDEEDQAVDAHSTTKTKTVVSIPTKEYAIHLIHTVKFHCCQLFHLYDEHEFMGLLDAFYSQPSPPTPSGREQKLWYIHFLLLLAFGKAFVSRKRHGRRPPGAEFFSRALELLPSTVTLSREPIRSVEILICLSLYTHCLDYRISAYNYIGQAIRLAMSEGMHTNVSPQQVGQEVAQRCRKIWSTVHVLDCEMTSWQGMPPSVNDDDVYTPLPEFPRDPGLAHALAMRIKLSHVIARVNRSIYGADGRMDSSFLMRTKEALPGIAELTDTLQKDFPLTLDDAATGISRLSAHIHLLYHQCIILATRPLLFCLLKLRLDRGSSGLGNLPPSPTVQSLAQMCLDSCFQIIRILECLQQQELLESFLVFDLEALSISTTNILLAPAITTGSTPNQPLIIQKAFSIFDELVANGNRIAELERSELQQLEGLLSAALQHDRPMPANQIDVQPPSYAEASAMDILPPPIPPEIIQGELDEPLSGMGFGILSTEQIMDLANSINMDHANWMTQAMRSPDI
ncbi:hypothetical protein HJFPF1_07452 [Paramyrothecium foliicola]|nr:hypothetical protein HJFPF1_07452 [Paramyrothecium foliicola]